MEIRKELLIIGNCVGSHHLAQLAKKTLLSYQHFSKSHHLKWVHSHQVHHQITGQKFSAPFVVVSCEMKNSTRPSSCRRILPIEDALSPKVTPKKIAIIGTHPYALDMANAYGLLGSQVTLLAYSNRLISQIPQDMHNFYQFSLAKSGLRIKLSVSLSHEEIGEEGVELTWVDDRGRKETEHFDYCFHADQWVVDIPLNVSSIGMSTDDRGRIRIDSFFQSSVQNFYVLGNALATPYVYHHDERLQQAEVVMARIRGQKPKQNFFSIPQRIYTTPQITLFGLPYQDCIEAALELDVDRTVDLHSSSYLEIYRKKYSQEILGGALIDPQGCELISPLINRLKDQGIFFQLSRPSRII